MLLHIAAFVVMALAAVLAYVTLPHNPTIGLGYEDEGGSSYVYQNEYPGGY